MELQQAGDLSLAGFLRALFQGQRSPNIFITKLDAGLECILFANNAKGGGSVSSLEVREALQRALSKSEVWAITDSVGFNKDK